MKALKKFGLGLLIIIALLVIVSFFLPSQIHVERTVTMDAPIEAVFTNVNNLKNWEAWSPWAKLDSSINGKGYEGPESGEGAKHCWDSKVREVGKGCMTLTEVVPNEKITTVMNFDGMDPFSGGFAFAEEDGKTKVTWSMDSETGMNPMMKYMGLMMDGWVGTQFESGLAALEVEAKKVPAVAPARLENIEQVQLEDAMKVVYIEASFTMDEMEQIGPTMGQLFGEIIAHVGTPPTTMPLSIYPAFGEDGITMQAGFPVTEAVEETDRIKMGELPAGSYVKASHFGDYMQLKNSHETIRAYMADNGLVNAGPPWEHYVTDPGDMSDMSNVETIIYYPVAAKAGE